MPDAIGSIMGAQDFCISQHAEVEHLRGNTVQPFAVGQRSELG